jgi:hypothetical protein
VFPDLDELEQLHLSFGNMLFHLLFSGKRELMLKRR